VTVEIFMTIVDRFRRTSFEAGQALKQLQRLNELARLAESI